MKKGLLKSFFLNLTGIFFVLFGILSIFNAIYTKNPQLIFWFCYISIIIMGFGIIFRNSNLMISQLNILLVPILLWNIDFFYLITTGKTFLGITNYFFEANQLLSRVISLQHLFSLPLALISLILIKYENNKDINKNLWIISFMEMAFIFLITYLFTKQNINCIYKSCISIQFSIPYILQWFIACFIIIFISNFIIVRILDN